MKLKGSGGTSSDNIHPCAFLLAPNAIASDSTYRWKLVNNQYRTTINMWGDFNDEVAPRLLQSKPK